MFTMKFLILVLFSPAVICVQRYRKSTNPNDEPFLPIHPEYPYNPKLMKRGIEQISGPQSPQQPPQQQAQNLAQLSPELYAPKVDARDPYSASYGQNPYLGGPAYDNPYAKSAATTSALATSPYLSPYSPTSPSFGSSPYGLLGSYGSPFPGSVPGYGGGTTPGPYSAALGAYGASPYGGTAAAGAYPNYYYQPPYYYPNYYNQPPYPPPPGYPVGPYKPKDENEDDDDDEVDEKRRSKARKSGNSKNRLRESDRDATNNHYVDGANFIISSAKDLDGESSTHRTPSTYNQIEDSDVHPHTVTLPKATYRLVSVSGQGSPSPVGYVKIQQLEQLMRQALARLLAQNAAQQASLVQIQEVAQNQAKDTGPYLALPNNVPAKTGLSYVVNPTILNRVTPGQYNPSQLINTQAFLGNGVSGKQKSVTSVSLQQSPGVYIPPKAQGGVEQSSPNDYGDYDSADSATSRGFQPTAEPARGNLYSTYRPTQQTSLEDVNFGSKQKSKS